MAKKKHKAPPRKQKSRPSILRWIRFGNTVHLVELHPSTAQRYAVSLCGLDIPEVARRVGPPPKTKLCKDCKKADKEKPKKAGKG